MKRDLFCEFKHDINEKKLIAFGASRFLEVISENYKELELADKISYLIDSDANKINTKLSLANKMKTILPPQRLLEEKLENIVILISADKYAYEIYMQISNMIDISKAKIYILSLMIANHYDDSSIQYLEQNSENKIPKKIHCFWFSKEKKEGIVKECFESWKRNCPDYEICEWNADNYDVTKNEYAYNAFKNKSWASVTDYARMDILNQYGGIYLDLDVRLFKNLDVLLKNDMFIAFGPIREIEAATIGSIKGHPYLNKILKIYDDITIPSGRSVDLRYVQPVLLDRMFEECGFVINGKFQKKDNVTIYPRDLFSGRNWFTGENEYTDYALGVHECVGGWADKSMRQAKIDGYKNLEEIFFGE